MQMEKWVGGGKVEKSVLKKESLDGVFEISQINCEFNSQESLICIPILESMYVSIFCWDALCLFVCWLFLNQIMHFAFFGEHPNLLMVL
jgi:hypothetical protein